MCTADKPSFEGKHYRISNLGFYPKPVQKPHPPVWIGGYSSAALRRAVRLGDGWHPSNLPPEALAEKAATDDGLKAMRKELATLRRARPKIVRTMIMRERVGEPRESYIQLGGDFTRKRDAAALAGA